MVVDSAKIKKDIRMDELSEKEIKLIQIIRKLEYGEVKIVVQDKQPVRIEELTRSIKL